MSVFSYGTEVWACAYGRKYLSKIDKFCRRAWTHGYTKKSIFIITQTFKHGINNYGKQKYKYRYTYTDSINGDQ